MAVWQVVHALLCQSSMGYCWPYDPGSVTYSLSHIYLFYKLRAMYLNLSISYEKIMWQCFETYQANVSTFLMDVIVE